MNFLQKDNVVENAASKKWKAVVALATCGVLVCLAAHEVTAAPIRFKPLKMDPLAVNPSVLAMASRPNFVVNAPLKVLSPSILQARGNLKKLQEIVTVEGFYYDGSVPMIVDDIERTQVDMIMPTESYVPLTARVASLKNGDRVSVTGRLVSPEASQKLQDEPSVLRIEGNVASKIRVLEPSKWRSMKDFSTIPGVLKFLPTKYAVLIAGGYNPSNSHLRYWNDLKTMYAILKARGYAPSRITVIYADGVGRDASMPVNYSATKANIQAAFSSLGTKMTSQDDLYVMLNDHGGGFLDHAISSYALGVYGGVIDPTNTDGKAISESAFNMDLNGDGDKTDVVHFHNTLALWGDSMTDIEFSNAVGAVANYNEMKIQMKQCFSGGFAFALAAPKRIVISSAGPNEVSWGHGDGSQFGNFTYWYFSALTGQTPDGVPAPFPSPASATVNADSNSDGKMSMLEAYDYARIHDLVSLSSAETPFYSDNGSPPVSGALSPASGQGARGKTSFLG